MTIWIINDNGIDREMTPQEIAELEAARKPVNAPGAKSDSAGADK